MLVATGRAEAMLDPVMALWDAAALKPIIEEAGGVFTDWDGATTHRGGSVVSTNAALARDLRTLLNRPA
jgi:fructose-1,6-bisphosphatase/inositol monophosphatase family enzyme